MAITISDWFESDASRLYSDIDRTMRNRGRLSPLIEKSTLPEQHGYNLSKVISERFAPTSVTWSEISEPDGNGNNCLPTITDMSSGTTVRSYTASEAILRSQQICFFDVSRAYDGEQQVMNIRKNFVDQVAETWEDYDKSNYFTNAAHKVIADSSMTDFANVTDFGAAAPTSRLTQDYLDAIYTQLVQDGAGEDAYATRDGAPVFTALMSMERKRDLIKNDASIRQDFQYAEMGKGPNATLLKSWGVDGSYGGFMHVIDNRMPRYDYAGGVWTARPYWTNSAAHKGTKSEVNSAYLAAGYEDVYIWHPKVVTRRTPRSPHSLGSSTEFGSVPYNGEIVWRNYPTDDNPFQDVGRYWARLVAAYEPNQIRYGYILRVKRCTGFTPNTCPASS